jgi:tetratricopeptide (TPR) repeat protein
MARREWVNRYKLKTENFEFEYTIDPDIMKGFAELMEVYYKNFTKEWDIKRPPKLGRLKVCFYHDQDYFHQVSGAPPGVIGYFRFFEPMELDFFYDRLDQALTIDVMFHETNHYLTTLIDPKFHYPIWINESLAEYYGASQWDPKTKKMTLGRLQEGRLATVQEAIKANEWQGLEALIRLEQRQFDATHYAWGWTFVYWLLENKETRQKFKDFYLALGRDKTVKREAMPQLLKFVPPEEQIRLLLKYLGAKDLATLEKGWHDHVRSLQASSGRGFYEAGRTALLFDKPLKAERFLREAIKVDYKTPEVYATLGQALWRSRKSAEAVEAMRQAVVLDPLNGEFYLGLARALAQSNKDDPEVKRNRWLALEVARATNDPNEYSILVDIGPDYAQPDPAVGAAPAGGAPAPAAAGGK